MQIDLDLCILCYACKEACPFEAIIVEDGKLVISDTCCNCMACTDYCPVEAIKENND